MQEDIIRSVMEGHDTLALLPTGGGKSVCFQVPAMAMEGICIVISPLIALMKDQVQGLQQKGIKAMAITSGMGKRELDIALDNCVYGDYKFLYLSPERLQSELVRARIKKMKVNLLAVDEAHCVSQWGYDFRPPYLKIAEVRADLPGVPVLALTATATLQVREDIREKMLFKGHHVFVKSFARPNLAYMVLPEDDKEGRLLKILKKVPGPAVVYVRNRRHTQELAALLKQQGVSADFYHAGLAAEQRSARQESWMRNHTRVMVATNAFGMGIDKPDVRVVVHMDLPESPEAYYQEAGRAGRDEKKSYAVLLLGPNDAQELERRYAEDFPSVEEIKQVYKHLGQFCNLAYGSGEFLNIDFDLLSFCRKFNLKPVKTIQALKFLEKNELILLSEEVFMPSRLLFLVDQAGLYAYQVANAAMDPFIKLILRSYGGVFDQYVRISERELATRHGTDVKQVKAWLSQLQQQNILSYEPMKNLPQLQFLGGRLPDSNLHIDSNYVQERKKALTDKIRAMLRYATGRDECRSLLLLNYFGEKATEPCGTCDVCLERKRKPLSESQKQEIYEAVLALVRDQNVSLPRVISELKDWTESNVLEVIQLYIDEGLLQLNDKNEVIKGR